MIYHYEKIFVLSSIFITFFPFFSQKWNSCSMFQVWLDHQFMHSSFAAQNRFCLCGKVKTGFLFELSSRITRFVLPLWYKKGMAAPQLANGQFVLSIISQYIEQCLFRRLDICFFIYWQFFVTAVFVRTLLDCISSIRMYLILNVTLSFCRSLSLHCCLTQGLRQEWYNYAVFCIFA